jgi:hypothetical protein
LCTVHVVYVENFSSHVLNTNGAVGPGSGHAQPIRSLHYISNTSVPKEEVVLAALRIGGADDVFCNKRKRLNALERSSSGKHRHCFVAHLPTACEPVGQALVWAIRNTRVDGRQCVVIVGPEQELIVLE